VRPRTVIVALDEESAIRVAAIESACQEFEVDPSPFLRTALSAGLAELFQAIGEELGESE
jgi:hypothetical protein